MSRFWHAVAAQILGCGRGLGAGVPARAACCVVHAVSCGVLAVSAFPPSSGALRAWGPFGAFGPYVYYLLAVTCSLGLPGGSFCSTGAVGTSFLFPVRYSYPCSRFCGWVSVGGFVESGVERAVGVMWERFWEPLCLDDLARCALVSKFHFLRVFSRVTGVTPGRFLSAVRVFEAKGLLVGSSLSVADVSAGVGYGSTGSFTRRFSESVGLSPTQYRRVALGGGLRGGVGVSGSSGGSGGSGSVGGLGTRGGSGGSGLLGGLGVRGLPLGCVGFGGFGSGFGFGGCVGSGSGWGSGSWGARFRAGVGVRVWGRVGVWCRVRCRLWVVVGWWGCGWVCLMVWCCRGCRWRGVVWGCRGVLC